MEEEHNEIIVKLQGTKIIDGRIEAYSLGNFLLNFQSIIDRIYQKNLGKTKVQKEMTKMYLKKISPGSAILAFESGSQKTLEPISNLMKAYDELKHLFQVIDGSPEEGRKVLIQSYEDTVSRLRIELGLRSIVENPFDITLYDGTGSEVKVNKNRLEYVYKWIEDDQKEMPQSIKGVIIRIKGDEPERTFTIMDENGKHVTCTYKQELEGNVISEFKSPVEIYGILKKKPKTPKVKEIIDLKPLKSLSTNEIASLRLNNSVKISVEYEDDIWCLNIPPLNANGCGYTLNRALEDLRESILGAYEIYVKDRQEEELSEKAKELRNKLLFLIGDDNYENVQKKGLDQSTD